MGQVYLIGQIGNEGAYKIGVTRSKDITKRLKKLQTGNSCELFVRSSYETNQPFLLERMLHAKYYGENVLNEWFELDDENVNKFTETCEGYQKIIDALKDNPFIGNKRKLIDFQEDELKLDC